MIIPIIRKAYYYLRGSYAYALIYTYFRFGSTGAKRNLYVQEVDHKGEGLFTNKAVKQGKVICVANGPVRFGHFEGDDCYLFPNWYGIESGVWVEVEHPFVKINHGCTPNVGISDTRTFVALRDIEADEELAYDYSTSDDEIDWKMDCACECSNCSGEIGSVQSISLERFDMSYPHMPKYFIKLYQKASQRN
tara:strand:+ start:538 stop:1113 length:576 start_codon:yes stop_codon:yes gene_type:complete